METIILILAGCYYYLFCVFAAITYVQEPRVYKFLEGLGVVIATMIVAPIAVPIVLGIKVGERIKDEN